MRISRAYKKGTAMKSSTGMTFNILTKKEGDLFIAHCLELDIVATGSSLEEANNDIIDLLLAQLKYAFANKNLDHLYRPAPPEVWREFYACRELLEREIKVPPDEEPSEGFVPPWIIAKMCQAKMESHV